MTTRHWNGVKSGWRDRGEGGRPGDTGSRTRRRARETPQPDPPGRPALKGPDRRAAPEGRGSCCLAAPWALAFTRDEADHGAQRLPHPRVER